MKKEILFGTLWGLTLGLIIVAILYSAGKSAVVSGNGDVDIAITGDSVRVEIDKDGIVKSITVCGDSLTRTPSGLKVQNDLLIADGKIFIDGVELTEEELGRLSVNQDQESSIGWKTSNKAHKHIRRKRLATVYAGSGGDLVKFNNVMVDSATYISGDVVSISGDVTVRGKVQGDVVSVFGDVYLDEGAIVTGDVAAPFGRIHRSQNVEIGGEAFRKVREKTREVSFGLSARFNRVEGFTFLPSLKYQDKKNRIPSLTMKGAYAVTLKRWEYDFRINHKLGGKIGPYFDFGMYQQAMTSDEWMFNELENTIAGLFFKEDFHDFYWDRGFTGKAGVFVGQDLTAGMEYTAARITNLEKTAERAIFGGKKRFRENWSTILPDSAAILDMAGDLRELALCTEFDSRNDKSNPQKGMLGTLDWRRSLSSGSENFDYQMVSGEIKMYLPIAQNQNILIRARGGYSDDNLPLFRQFFLGGVGSLRGYEYKEYEGNRSMLFSSDYVWRFYHTDFGAGIFVDAGKAAKGGKVFENAELKSDIGISFLIEDAFRLDLAQRLDDLNKAPVISARLQMTL